MGTFCQKCGVSLAEADYLNMLILCHKCEFGSKYSLFKSSGLLGTKLVSLVAFQMAEEMCGCAIRDDDFRLPKRDQLRIFRMIEWLKYQTRIFEEDVWLSGLSSYVLNSNWRMQIARSGSVVVRIRYLAGRRTIAIEDGLMDAIIVMMVTYDGGSPHSFTLNEVVGRISQLLNMLRFVRKEYKAGRLVFYDVR